MIIKHCANTYKYKEENIILIGRSLGTGVAIKMGLVNPNLRGIVLISPYSSIRDVAENMFGVLGAKIVPNIFQTKDIIAEIKPPVLFIHGLRDRLIPCSKSSYLYDQCTSPKMLNISPTMDHNKVDYRKDLYLPILKFFVDKLDMTEFTDDYNSDELFRVSALSSLENNELRKMRYSALSNPDDNLKPDRKFGELVLIRTEDDEATKAEEDEHTKSELRASEA